LRLLSTRNGRQGLGSRRLRVAGGILIGRLRERGIAIIAARNSVGLLWGLRGWLKEGCSLSWLSGDHIGVGIIASICHAILN